MGLALSIILIFLFAISISLAFVYILKLEESKEPKKSVKTDDIIRPTESSVKEVLDSALKYAPKGCMWNVEKIVKTYHKTGDVYVFDGAAETVFVSVALITGNGPFKSFSIPLESGQFWLHNFKTALSKHVQSVLREYRLQLDEQEIKTKHLENWEGVYQEDV